jgi:hypothetical protein
MKSTDKLTQYDQHRLLIAAAQETELDWPKFFDWKPVMMTKEVILAVSLVAALLVFAILSWYGLGYFLDTISFLALK